MLLHPSIYDGRPCHNHSTKLFLCFTLAVVFALMFAAQCFPAQVTLQWDPNTETTVAGYKLYYGTSSRNYSNAIDVGKQTSYMVSNLQEGTTYYCAVTAYSSTDESDFSKEVSFTPAAQKTIAASTGTNGSINPSGSILVSYGGTQTFSITSNSGYHVADVLVDGASAGVVSSYTFSNVTSNHTISVSFDADATPTNTITATAGQNGSISPSGNILINEGSSQSFSITPNAGYSIADVLVDGASVGAVGSYEFVNVTSDHTISVSFKTDVAATYIISAAAGQNGSISPGGSISVNKGSNQSFSITPNTGYEIADVLVDGLSVGAVGSYAFATVSADHSISASFKEDDTQPVADAGPDQKVKEAETVTLNGLNSTDPDDGIVSYKWTQLEGTTVILTNSNPAQTSFTAPNVGLEGMRLSFQLAVTDKAGHVTTDTCLINVVRVNEQPVANAGSDQKVNEWDNVMLDGSGSNDPDDGIASYSWKQTSGPPIELSDSLSAQPTFTAPTVDSKGVSLVFLLTVTDNGGLQSQDTCIVNVTWANTPPKAKAARGRSVRRGETVTLSGLESYDPDSGDVKYRWTQLRGKPVTLSNPEAGQPSFIVPDVDDGEDDALIQLTVTDQEGLRSTDTCTFTFSDDNEPETTHKMLWTRAIDGFTSLWTLDSSDNFISYKTYGPYNGWAATSYQKNSEGTAKLLWTRSSDGLTSLWTLDANDNRTSYKLFGPYPGWIATSYHQNSDGTAKLLWTRSSDGLTSLWTLDANDNRTSYKLFGPYPGWIATSCHQNSDGTAKLLWTRSSDGLTSLWTLSTNGTRTSYTTYGPYPGWSATSYQKNSDGTTQLLWTRESDGLAALWFLDSSQNRATYKTYGPYPGWTSQSYN